MIDGSGHDADFVRQKCSRGDSTRYENIGTRVSPQNEECEIKLLCFRAHTTQLREEHARAILVRSDAEEHLLQSSEPRF